MALSFDFISATDKPALLGISTHQYHELARAALTDMGYKVHSAENHEQFLDRFGRAQYQVVVIEDAFGGVLPEQNEALTTLQGMQMSLRRHATVILIGDLFESMNAMQAFQQSVHAVINPADLGQLPSLLQQIINDSNLFLSVYRDVQARIAEGKK